MLDPFPFLHDDWRWRWLQTDTGTRLHRIAIVEWDWSRGDVRGPGASVCGIERWFSMPGFFSRMDAQRCPVCCRLLGIPNGRGAPFNALKGRYAHA